MTAEIEETPRGLTLRVMLRLRSGLHARPAARLAQEAQRFASDILLICDNGEADAKSMLDVLSLMPAPDDELMLLADGPDAREALQALAELFNSLQD